MYNISKYLKNSFNKLSPFTTAKSQFIPMLKHWGFLDSFRKYFASLIWGAVNGVDKATLLSPFHSHSESKETVTLCEGVCKVAAGSFKTKEPPEIKGTGYVIQSLEAALWAFNKTASFKEGVLLAVNLGDDADATGAVYGQLAGAYYGEGAIPPGWVSKIAKIDFIENPSRKRLPLW